MALSLIVARDAVLCTDGLAGYAAFAQSSRIEHFVIKAKPGQKAVPATHPIQNIKKAVPATHPIQNINSLHSGYKDFTRPFRGLSRRVSPMVYRSCRQNPTR
jgi:hypothetical protein